MNFNDYQKDCARTAPVSDDKLLEMMHWALGIVAEGGEVADLIKKVAFHGHGIEPEKIIFEIGDVLFYCTMLAYLLGYDLHEVVEMNVMKRQERYPEGFSSEKSINRKEEK